MKVIFHNCPRFNIGFRPQYSLSGLLYRCFVRGEGGPSNYWNALKFPLHDVKIYVCPPSGWIPQVHDHY